MESYPESLKHLPETKKTPQIFTNKIISFTLRNTGIADKISIESILSTKEHNQRYIISKPCFPKFRSL